MKVLFLTTARFEDIESKGIYSDLLREFSKVGNQITIVCPNERRFSNKSKVIKKNNVQILFVWTTNLQKTNLIEKGVTTFLIEYLFYFSIKKHLDYKNFDLIIYSTPPITFANLIKKLKLASNAKTYLLLKDIFPQNAVDLNIISKNSILHKYYSAIEKKLYEVSDVIGCMSEENVAYIISQNPHLNENKIEVNPNSIDSGWLYDDKDDSTNFRNKMGIKQSALICVYGGNLGKPQGLDFLIEILKHFNNDSRIFFFIVGDGTEFEKLNLFFQTYKPTNASLQKFMPKSDFDELIKYGDAGLILLDRRFTIPNFPSRLLSYMENKMSVWAATDINTDIRSVVEDNNIGFWVENGDLGKIVTKIECELKDTSLNKNRGRLGYEFLKNNYTVDKSYNAIVKWFVR